jgi:hypothetical protein
VGERGRADGRVLVGIEATGKRAFASTLDWPGWSRSGRDGSAALAALGAVAARYVRVLEVADMDAPGADAVLDILERLPGTSTTDFGAPDVAFEADARPAGPVEAQRLASLVRATWDALDAAAALAPAALRKGPRGGGRDRDAIVAHVASVEAAYGRRIGLRFPEPAAGDAVAREANRAAILDVLRRPSDGAPIAGGRWPVRYAARRIAWHVLDHAWEIEDRSSPGD